MTFEEKILKTACEGIVLLKNTNNALPLTKNDSVSVFGRMQIDYQKCGLGSGGSVHAPYSTNIVDSLIELEESNEGPKVNRGLVEKYRTFCHDNLYDTGGGKWAGEPWFQKEIFVTEEMAEAESKESNKAVFVIGRNAGEDKDLQIVKGSWLLQDDEYNSIKNLCKFYDSVIVVFNTCGIIDTAWTENPDFCGKIDAVLYGWQGGQEGGKACAQVLCGKSIPSGKLADTIAKHIEDYPSTEGFGNTEKLVYKEDVYVGYRYFSTFAPEKILYPFGFGLSYTTFAVKTVSASKKDDEITISVSVRNTGAVYSGKEVVQVYFEAPQGKLGKPKIQLAAFKKSKELKPGEEQILEISCDIKDFASYDDSGATGNKNCFVLEAGEYRIYAGTDSVHLEQVDVSVVLEENRIVGKTHSACAPVEDFERISPLCEKEKVPVREYDLSERIMESLPEEIKFTGDTGIKFSDVKEDPSKIDAFIAQLTPEELATLVRGEGMMSRKATPGIASVFGGTSDALYKYGVPVAGCSDGPSGARLDTGKEASLMPTGTVISCTWNTELAEDLFESEGKELAGYEIDCLLGPGINIHRNPLNGRNFEYFSEDPLLTGKFAAAELRGLSKHGVFGTIKHFATNNQETNRYKVNSVLSERALREIYLRPFKIAVDEGGCKSIMTTYNPLNGYWTASNYDLVTTILRKEWKFDGFVMTDWWAKMNDVVKGGEMSIEDVRSMVRAGNDVYMVCENNAADKDGNNDNIKASLKNGSLTVGELQHCAKNVVLFLTKALVSSRPLRSLHEYPVFKPKLQAAPENAAVVDAEYKFMKDGVTKACIRIESENMYNILGSYRKDSDGLMSQSVTNILIDGVPAASFECKSTSGKSVQVNAAQIMMHPGIYEIELSDTKPGIQVDFIGFSAVLSTSTGITMLKD